MQKEIKDIVKEKYTEFVTKDSSCCAPDCCSPGADTTFSDSYDHLAGYESDADLGLGCGIPTEAINVKKGDTVLDLGSGAGNDVFVARALVGEEGKVLGLDMTEAMIEKANLNKAKLGYENVEFILGEIENIPLPENTTDFVISNCVMNLVPDKLKGYSEVFKVLKPGGQFSMSDIVTSGDLTEEVLNVAALYAGCVSGAMKKEEYLQLIAQIGFTDVNIFKEKLIDLPDEFLLQYLSKEALDEFRQKGAEVISITVTGTKPA